MKRIKKQLLWMLVAFVFAACVLCMASCGKENSNAHTHDYAEKVIAPTCTANGYTEYSCECGDAYTANEIPAAHTMNNVEAKEPTCTEDGYTAYSVCSVCGHIEGVKEVVEALGHQYNIEAKEPTCTEDGHTAYGVCTVCEYVEDVKEVIEALGHQYKISYIYPTVTTDGARVYTCEHCAATKTETINAMSATLPKVSAIIANIIGNVSYSFEIEEDSELVYVTDLSDYDNGQIGVKGFVFFELAEAMISGEGDNLEAHLKINVGTTEIELTGLVPAKDVVAPDKLEIGELYIYVNGDDVSFEVITPDGETNKFSENISVVLYDAIGGMFGLDYEAIAEFSYMMSELERLYPIVEKVVDTAEDGIPTISPEHVERLEALLSLVGEKLLVESTDADGNTVYTVDPLAFKLFLNKIENKTVAEYLAGVYGEDVVSVLADFLKSLPKKTVKEIADSAVAFVDETGVPIEDVYVLIDMYVYLATDTDFSIESEIFSRYDLTVAEVIAELSGVAATDKAEFVNSMNASFKNVARALETVTVEDVLNHLYAPGDEDASLINDLLAMIDVLDEGVDIVITVDANDEIVSVVATAGDFDFCYEFDGVDAKYTIADGELEVVVVENDNSVNVVVNENGSQIAYGGVTVTETVSVNGIITTTVVADLRDDEIDFLDYTVVYVNGEITTADIVLNGYVSYSDPELDIPVDEYVTLLTLYYNDYKDGTKDFMIGNDDVLFALIYEETVDSNHLNFLFIEGEKIVSTCEITATEEKLNIVVADDENKLCELYLELNDTLDVLEKAYIEINGYFHRWDEETEENVQTLENLFRASFEFIDNANGMDNVRVEYMDMVFVLGYEETETGVTLIITDENEDNTLLSIDVTFEESIVTVDAIAGTLTVLDAAVTVTETVEGDTVVSVIDIDIDQLLLYTAMCSNLQRDPSTGKEIEIFYEEYNYIEFDGAIKVTIS